ncbi:MAG TPA: substrate-binding domain-containing protein [Acidobacteriaceae bacterium]|nr:substrate-binding domain-containing protein [Acidobacteriaceae bacterium]
MKMRRTILAWGALSLLGAATGCHRQPPTIAVIMPTGGLHYWEVFSQEVQKDSAGMHVEMSAPQAVTDYTEQAQLVENAIAQHVQGIIVSPSHQMVLASVLRKAELQHIPVVVVGTPIALPARDYAAFIGWDEEEAGRLAARRFLTLLGGHGEVGIVGVSPTVEGSSRIEEGFADEIARTPQLKLVGVRYGLSDWARARQATLDLVAEHPEIGGIFTTAEFSTHAAAVAFESWKGHRPALIGVSEEIDELRALRDGGIDALVISDPQELGRRAMQAMRVALSGAPASAYSAQLPVQIIDRDTMARNPIVGLLTQGELQLNASEGTDLHVAP